MVGRGVLLLSSSFRVVESQTIVKSFTIQLQTWQKKQDLHTLRHIILLWNIRIQLSLTSLIIEEFVRVM